ncbi:helix-turn-helix domain-containing protein [Pelomonas sp. Root1237]|uniref:helix-turn-helix domain-containing protein n=1 Tax=Pelomonas sp. Root1237 TaxID=1736434 RepID=UPI0006FEE3DF|nr:helix-turn-helix domain-containing protein [Pelomonas sp. Root1237]KQV85806.1 XRE family transcriptional regulator [Pelomonas sp. Root1237]
MTSNPTAPPPELLRVVDAGALGPAIRARRRAQSLRIDDAASLSGVSVDLLSRLENGKGSVRLDKLLAVLDSLGLALVLGPKDHPTMQSVSRPGVEPAEQP